MLCQFMSYENIFKKLFYIMLQHIVHAKKTYVNMLHLCQKTLILRRFWAKKVIDFSGQPIYNVN